VYLVGNFADMEEEREVQQADALELVKTNNYHNYFETSALTGQNVQTLFEVLTKHLFLINESRLEQFRDEYENGEERESSTVFLKQPSIKEKKKKKKCC